MGNLRNRRLEMPESSITLNRSPSSSSSSSCSCSRMRSWRYGGGSSDGRHPRRPLSPYKGKGVGDGRRGHRGIARIPSPYLHARLATAGLSPARNQERNQGDRFLLLPARRTRNGERNRWTDGLIGVKWTIKYQFKSISTSQSIQRFIKI